MRSLMEFHLANRGGGDFLFPFFGHKWQFYPCNVTSKMWLYLKTREGDLFIFFSLFFFSFWVRDDSILLSVHLMKLQDIFLECCPFLFSKCYSKRKKRVLF